MQDKDKVSKLDELNLDDFAVTMYESNNNLKQHALNIIKMNSCGHSERCGRTIILGCPHYAYQGDGANASHWVRNILRVLSCIISGSKKRKKILCPLSPPFKTLRPSPYLQWWSL